MGQAAEDYEYLQYKQSLPYSDFNPQGYKVTPTWTMRDGSKVKVTEMETSHINNCVRLLEKKIVDPYAHGEPDGEAAYDAFMVGVGQVEERNRAVMHNINLFKKELKIRETN